jgi:chromosomal replication initiator protein
MVLDRPGEITPLFLYGPSGTGKTHLLEGVWSEIRRTRPVGNRVVYLSAEQFTSPFLEALKGSGLPNFRQKYRRADVLILDDVQFFAGKRATINEVQNTVDEMLREGRQLVMAADRPPAQLAELGAALTTRLSSGMVCALQAGDRQMRLSIARQMCTARKLEIPRSVLEYIAEHMPGDARHLGGALNRLQATSLAHGRPIDLALAREALADLVRANQRAIRLDDVQRAVCEVLGMENAQLQSNVKAKSASHPRMLAMFLARRHTRAALSEIGEHFGHRSHTTVVSAQKKVEAWIDQHSSLTVNGRTWNVEQAIREIENRLQVG